MTMDDSLSDYDALMKMTTTGMGASGFGYNIQNGDRLRIPDSPEQMKEKLFFVTDNVEYGKSFTEKSTSHRPWMVRWEWRSVVKLLMTDEIKRHEKTPAKTNPAVLDSTSGRGVFKPKEREWILFMYPYLQSIMIKHQLFPVTEPRRGLSDLNAQVVEVQEIGHAAIFVGYLLCIKRGILEFNEQNRDFFMIMMDIGRSFREAGYTDFKNISSAVKMSGLENGKLRQAFDTELLRRSGKICDWGYIARDNCSMNLYVKD